MPSQLPLFPLRIVLFPGALLPLHIFEPRYRRLLDDVAASDHRFGLLPPGEAGELPAPGAIGCVALIRAIQPLDAGRSNIVVGGGRRFVFLEPAPAATPYHQGLVDWIDDRPDVQLPTADDLARLRALGERYAQAIRAVREEVQEVELTSGPAELSFEIAALLDWDYEVRQRFLEVRSATERVARLLHALPGMLAAAEERALVHGRAKGNGHGSVS